MRHRFAEEVHISLIVRQVWCQVNRRRLYGNHEIYSGRRVLTVLIIKLQWQPRLIRNKSEFYTVLGEEHCGQDENNTIVPARPSPNWTGPARRTAELIACLIQLGHPPSWSRVRSSSAIRRAGLFVFWFRGSSLFETYAREILPRVCREGLREDI